MRFGALSVGSGGAKTFEAILLGFLDAPASSSYPPKMLLEPPPGGRNTLQTTTCLVFKGSVNVFIHIMYTSAVFSESNLQHNGTHLLR